MPLLREGYVPSRALICPYCTGNIQQHETLHSKVCFVATATLGAEHPSIDVLRAFRDTVLLPSVFGRAFIRAYYIVGAYVATKFLQRSPVLRVVSRVLIVSPSTWIASRVLRQNGARHAAEKE